MPGPRVREAPSHRLFKLQATLVNAGPSLLPQSLSPPVDTLASQPDGAPEEARAARAMAGLVVYLIQMNVVSGALHSHLAGRLAAELVVACVLVQRGVLAQPLHVRRRHQRALEMRPRQVGPLSRVGTLAEARVCRNPPKPPLFHRAQECESVRKLPCGRSWCYRAPRRIPRASTVGGRRCTRRRTHLCEGRTGEDGVLELCVAKVGAVEVGGVTVGVRQVHVCHLGLPSVRPGHLRSTDFGAREVCALHHHAGEHLG